MSGYYDNEIRFRNYKDMFDPKYNRTLINAFIVHGIAPEPNGNCRSYEDFVAASNEENSKKAQIEALGYDPESIQLLSRKQKAKVRKYKLREKEEILSKEKWEEKKFGKKEFRETIKLFRDDGLTNQHLKECQTSMKNKLPWNLMGHGDLDLRWRYNYNPHRGLIIGNRIKGLYSRYGRGGLDRRDIPDHKENQLHLLKLQLEDFILETNESQGTEELLKVLLGS